MSDLRLKNFLIFIFAFLLLGSLTDCRKKLKKDRWEVDVLTPLVHGEVGMSSLIGDSLLASGDEGELSLVFQNSLYQHSFADKGFEIPDTALKQVVTLDSIVLGNRSVSYPITLGQIARNDNSGIGGAIINLHGQNFPIPKIPGTSSLGQEVDATGIFESATLSAGFLDISIMNGFPVPIDTLIFRLTNKISGDVLVYDTFPYIPSGATVTESYDIGGKTVEGTMIADIIKFTSPGSSGNPVKIDTNDALILTVLARDLDILEAKAVFPSQNLINIKNEVTYFMDGPELTFLKIKSGNLVITAINTIEDSLHLHYQIPGAISSTGQPIDVFSTVPPAPPGGSVSIEETIPLDGYSIDLTGEHHTLFNTFYNEFTARIDSSGKLIFISLDDSVSVFYGLQDIVPEYVEGYLGSETFDVGPENVPFGLFKNFESGILDIEEIDVSFNIYNEIGASAALNVNYLRSVNSRNGTSIDLNAPFIGQTLNIKRALKNPFIPGITRIDLDNTNIESMLESLPDRFVYDLELSINPEGNKYNYQDFMHLDDFIDVTMDMEVPLSFSAEDLTLTDTFDFDLTKQETLTRSIKSGTFYFLIDNMFPMDAEIQVHFLDGQGKVLTSLFKIPQLIEAGEPDATACRVFQPNHTRLEAAVDELKMKEIRKARSIKFIATFNTVDKAACGTYTKIYEDYDLNFKLTGRFVYGVDEL